MSDIVLKNITKRFGKSVAVDNLNLTIADGDFITLLGPSGCGKTTTLRMIAGLETPTEGEIWIDGKCVFSAEKGINVPPSKRDVGFLFQNYALWPHMTVYQNISFGLENMKWPKDRIRKKVDELLKMLKIEEFEKRYPSELSGGQQQRVALARAIVTGPKVLLLDEPLSAIDAKLRHSLQIEIRRIQKEFNMTTIFVTHDQDEAMVMSDEIHLFHDGRIEQSGTPTEMYTAPRTRFAAGFIGSYNIFTAAEFKKLCGEDTDAPDVAIRPEVVRLNYETSAPAPRYYAKGTIVNSLSHGNLVRYTVRCHDIDINSDVMFEKHSLLEVGEEVEVSIRKTNVIMLY